MSEHLDQEKLERIAEVAVRVGVNLQEGQDLVLTAPIAALPLVRLITKYAYKAGAGVVMPFFTDDDILLARYEHGHEHSFDRAPDWFYESLAAAFKGGAARMAISGDDPMLLSDQDPDKVIRVLKANTLASKPAMKAIVGFEVNWNIVSFPSASWASRLFPDVSVEDAQEKLLDQIYAASRMEGDDPVANWSQHSADLKTRMAWLNDQSFSALKYTGPGTDLMLGLADDHIWKGGASEALNGVTCQPNIPTEEVFTCPHAYKVDGTVSATKPLAYNGTVIEDIVMTFEAGRVVEATSSTGQKVLQNMLATDDGACRIGEVALVPIRARSVSQVSCFSTHFLTRTPLVISHWDSAMAIQSRMVQKLNPSEQQQKGGNQSTIHVDWMIGSDKIDIDGITRTGETVPVMRKGEWAF